MAQPLMNEDPPYLLRRDDHGVTTLTLNRGDRLNPLSEAMMTVLQREIDAIATDPRLNDDQKQAMLAIYRSFVAGDTTTP